MKKYLLATLATIALVSLVACGPDSEVKTSQTSADSCISQVTNEAVNQFVSLDQLQGQDKNAFVKCIRATVAPTGGLYNGPTITISTNGL
jgi:predicted small lipoprotein YifL